MSALQNQYKQEENGEKYLRCCKKKKKTTQFRTLRPETQVALMVNTCLPAQEKLIDVGLIPGLVSFPGGGHGNPLQYSCLENPKDRGAWWATVHGVTKSQT